MTTKKEIDIQVANALELFKQGKNTDARKTLTNLDKSINTKQKELTYLKRKLRKLNSELADHERNRDFLQQIKDQLEVLTLVIELTKCPLSIEEMMGNKNQREQDAKTFLAIQRAWEKNGTVPPNADGTAYYKTQVRIEGPVFKRFIPSQDATIFIATNGVLLLKLFSWKERNHLDEVRAFSKEDMATHYNNFCYLMWLTICMMTNGRIFRISSQLANTFACADVSVGADCFRLPFETVMLILPSGFGVHVGDTFFRATDVIMVLTPTTNNQSLLRVIVGTAGGQGAPTLLYNVLLGGKATLHEDLLAYQAEMVNLTPTYAMELQSNKHDDPVYRLLTTVVNTFMYCTSFPDQVELSNLELIQKQTSRVAIHQPGSTKRKKAEAKLRQQKSSSIYIVGKNFQLDDTRCRERLESGHKLRSRHIVRGHWRNQACGIEHKERKLIFIQPFWKGSGPVTHSKDYIVK